MIEIKINDDSKEAFERAMGLFKKLCQRDGFIQEIKERKYYKKPSVQKKEKSERARKR